MVVLHQEFCFFSLMQLGPKKKDLDMKQGITPEQTVKQYLVT